MLKKLAITGLLLQLFITPLLSQVKAQFSGDPAKYRQEMTAFMGPNLNDEQKAVMASFLSNCDSTLFGKENIAGIMDLTSQFASKGMRPSPHFIDLFSALNTMVQMKSGERFIKDWVTGLSELSFNPRYPMESIDKYLRNSKVMVRDNIIYDSQSTKWKVKNCKLEFVHDTVFKVVVKDATLTCYSIKDSTEIYNASGIFFPDLNIFRGARGRVTWEKAGYAAADVFAEIENYIINTTKTNFTIDSARMTHKTFFKKPVYGSLSDQAMTYKNKETADFPRFETYEKQFKLREIYPGVDYEGGLAIYGASLKGTGTKLKPARITLSRNDTLYLNLKSIEFMFSKTGLVSAETAMSLYLGKDSIYHSNLSFSYNSANRQVSLFRGNNPISKSPYFDSFHKLDMYFELLSWNMKESKIILSRARGASLGQAQFESASFFDANYFMKLAGIDEYHPLVRFKKFAEWFYSPTFPVEEFAKWLNRPVDMVTGLCIDMANKGFVFYDRQFNEVTVKPKVNDFLDAYAKKKDYDVLYIQSETKAPLDNASLDLKNFRMTVNGVSQVFLSDSQRVAFYPYGRKIVIGQNRNMEFDGVVEAGLFTVFGHKFSFNYDTFKIRLQRIDSIKIAVETDKVDRMGNHEIKNVDNLIQLGTAELFIDAPNNKSGLRNYRQYPVINAVTYSYIFYDKIPGLEGKYPQKDFYFRIDPFTYNNIDHYTNKDMNLAGEFHAGKIMKPMKEYLTIQENNSLGFNMNVPTEGIEIYEGRGKIFENLSMSNKGLIGSGSVKHLTSTTFSDEFSLYPDSMLTQARTFDIVKDPSGIFPDMASENVRIKWLPEKDKWMATNTKGKNFNMFGNGTILDGSLTLSSSSLIGSGIVETTDSRLSSDKYRFTTNSIKADTAIYDLKSTSTNGYSFIAENAATDVNFDLKRTKFHLNTDTSLVKFPEMQYICKMTDFEYNMDSKVLSMEQKGKVNSQLLTPDKLVKVDFAKLDKPTFLATNVIGDTISFLSLKGTYHMTEEYIEAENINYIHVADALIQPDKGKIVINRRAKIQQLQNAVIAVNNRHIIHDAKIDIESTKKYSGSGIYDYIDEKKDIQKIIFPEIVVDTLKTSAKGYIPVSQKFMLSPEFNFQGDVALYSKKDNLLFNGGAGIVHNCNEIKSYPVKFKSYIDPKNVMIPIADKPRDINDNMVFSGSYINLDSVHIYPAFLSAQKSWTDAGLVTSKGYLWFDKTKSKYVITTLEKIADPSRHDDMVSLDKSFCVLSGEGRLNFGANFDLVKLSAAGKVIHTLDSNDVNIQALLGFEFYFSPEALKVMSDEIRMMPSLKPVNLNTDFYSKGMKSLIGLSAANEMKENVDLFGTSKNLPKEFSYQVFLNDVNLFWNEATSSFRSTGKIGIGYIGTQPVNVYVDGFVEIQRRRSGDMFDIYLKADESTWYYFSYVRGNMMTQAGNNAYNTLIANTKLSLRKHPESTVRQPYTYMISVEDRLGKFLQRMTAQPVQNDQRPSVK
jgi:hypothetical protein